MKMMLRITKNLPKLVRMKMVMKRIKVMKIKKIPKRKAKSIHKQAQKSRNQMPIMTKREISLKIS